MLPVLWIDVGGQSIPDENKITGSLRVIEDHDGTLTDIAARPSTLEAPIGIEYRGQWSLQFPKKGYSIELRDSAREDLHLPFLGMPEESDWVLRTGYYDRTLMRDALGFWLFSEVWGRYASRFRFVEVYLGYRIPGVGLVALVLIIIGIGAIASNILGRRLIRVVEGIVARIPIIRWIYRTTKQLFSTLLAERSTSFRKVVLINYPYKGMYSMAFQTSETAGPVEHSVGGKRLVTLFLPTTPNPTSGFFLLVPEEDVIPLDLSVDEGLKYIISAGALASGNDEDE